VKSWLLTLTDPRQTVLGVQPLVDHGYPLYNQELHLTARCAARR
jgi:hypothetical protein